MKVPPSTKPPEKQPTYDKDRTATRRSVAGAAGGMKGVDYEDDGRPALGQEAPTRRAGAAGGAGGEGRGAPPQVGSDSVDRGPAQPDAARILAENEGAQPKPLHTRRRRRFVARDRLTIDKDAPEARRRAAAEEDEEDEEAPDERSAEQTLEFFPDAVGDAAPSVSRAQLFSPDTKPEPGDLSLTDPDTIQRALETPLAYAKHAMILAEAFRRSTGATRAEAVDYLGRLFVSPRDRTFGRSALKEFGPSSGILDVYPLEVIEHVLARYPDFLPKVSLGRFFDRQGTRAEVWRTDTRTPVVLEYPEDLKIRGFALRGGGRPGYVFEPDDVLGRYRLLVQTPGRWTCLVSGVSRTGHTTVETAIIDVTLAPGDVVPPTLPELYPARDAGRVEQWPMPTPSAIAAPETSGVHAAPADEGPRLSTSELLHQRALDDERRLRDVDLEVSEEDAPISDRRIASPEPAGLAIPAAETARAPLRVPPASTQGRSPRPAAPAASEEARALGARASIPPAATDPSVRVTTESTARVPPKAATDPQVRAITAGARAAPQPTATTSGSMRVPAEIEATARSGVPTATTSGSMRVPAEIEVTANRATASVARASADAAPAQAAPRAPGESSGAPPRGAAAHAPREPEGAAARSAGPHAAATTSPARATIASRVPAAAITEPGARVPGASTSPRAPAPSGAAPRAAPTAAPRPAARGPEGRGAGPHAPGPPPPPQPSAASSAAASRVTRPRPKPRPEPAPSRAAAPPGQVDRAEISGAIADAFARLAATPIAPASPSIAAAPAGGAPPAHVTGGAAGVIVSEDIVGASPGPHRSARAPSPRPAFLEVRPRAPLLDDTDTPATADEVAHRAALASDEPLEVDPADVHPLDSPTARIAIRPELAADLMLDPPPADLPIGRPRLAPRALRRGESQADSSGGTGGEDPDR